MALQLFRVVGSGTAVTRPTVSNYFYKVIASGSYSIYVISATSFQTNTGGAAASLTTMTDSNGYYLLYVNGVLQQGNYYTVASDNVTITKTTGGTNFNLKLSAPITLTVTNFAPVTTFQG